MSGKSSPRFKSRISSRFSRLKQRVSLAFSTFPPAPTHLQSPFTGDNAGELDVPGRLADTCLLPVSGSHSVPVPTDDTKPAHSLQSPSCCNCHLSPSPLQLAQGHASSCQRPSVNFFLEFPDSFSQCPFQPSGGRFSGAHGFIVNDPVFIDHNTNSDTLMEKLLHQTIIGAEFDSSDRDPPPRCHPGTRLAILQRCLEFILQSHGEEKIRWVVGPAGVGKSAVMQMVAEKVPNSVIFASIFLSINGRKDGTKAILTIAYQFAVKCEPYYQFVRDQIIRDPSLLRKSMTVQFQRFIVEPFIVRCLFNAPCRFLVTIDGLDECDNPSTQEKLLELIADFCATYPTSPIAWIIASRPEPHITSFFERAEIRQVYTKEEMEIDSDEAREDVQRYLRDELKKIRLAYPTLCWRQEWPLEHEFTQIATAAGGLFAYASTVVRYIGDPHYRNPAAQLRNVLSVIDAGTKGDRSGRVHPMVQLDALYRRIISNIQDDVIIDTRKLLLIYSRHGWPAVKFREQCNMLGLTENAAYGAICHLHAVMKVPDPDKAAMEPLSYYHKSFEDFLFDRERSGLFDNSEEEAEQSRVHAVLRIIGQVQDDVDGTAGSERIECGSYGCLKGGCDNISLSWPGDERFQMTDNELRIRLYRRAMTDMFQNFNSDRNFYGSISCFHVLTTRFNALGAFYPFNKLRDLVFDKFRQELEELGQLEEVPLRALDYAAICGPIQLRCTSPFGIEVELTDSWNLTCNHRKDRVEEVRQWQGWSTLFERCYGAASDDNAEKDTDIPRFNTIMRQESHKQCFKYPNTATCNYCCGRLARYLVNNEDQLALVFVDSTQMCYVELSFVDPDDGVSEWRYRFLHSGPPEDIDK